MFTTYLAVTVLAAAANAAAAALNFRRSELVDQAISDVGIDEGAWIVNGCPVILGLSLVGFAISFLGPSGKEQE